MQDVIDKLKEIQDILIECMKESVDDPEEILANIACGADEYYEALEHAINLIRERG